LDESTKKNEEDRDKKKGKEMTKTVRTAAGKSRNGKHLPGGGGGSNNRN